MLSQCVFWKFLMKICMYIQWNVCMYVHTKILARVFEMSIRTRPSWSATEFQNYTPCHSCRSPPFVTLHDRCTVSLCSRSLALKRRRKKRKTVCYEPFLGLISYVYWVLWGLFEVFSTLVQYCALRDSESIIYVETYNGTGRLIVFILR